MALDYTSLLNPQPSQAVARGGSMVADALDAVMQRRQQQEMQRQQLAQAAAQAHAVDERERFRVKEESRNARLSRFDRANDQYDRDLDRDEDRRVRLAGLGTQGMAAAAGLAQVKGGLPAAQQIMESLAALKTDMGTRAEARARPVMPPDDGEPVPQQTPTGPMRQVDQWGAGPGQQAGMVPDAQPPPAAAPMTQAQPPAPRGWNPDPNVNRERAAALMDPIGSAMRFAQEPPVQQRDVQPPSQPTMDPAAAAVAVGQQQRAPAPAAQPSLFAGMTPEARMADFQKQAAAHGFDPKRLGKHGQEAWAGALAAVDAGGSLSKDAWDNVASGIELDSQEGRARDALAAQKDKGGEAEKERALRRIGGEFQSYLDKNKFPTAKEAEAQFAAMNDMGSAAKRGDGAGSASIFKGLFTKYAQGQVGVLNEHDIKIFWDAMGDPETKTMDYAERALTGRIGPDKLRLALAAVQKMIGSNKARMEGLYQGATPILRQGEQYGGWGSIQSQAYFGRRLPAETPGGATPTGAPAAGPATGPATATTSATPPAVPGLSPEQLQRFKNAKLRPQ